MSGLIERNSCDNSLASLDSVGRSDIDRPLGLQCGGLFGLEIRIIVLILRGIRRCKAIYSIYDVCECA